MTKKQAIQYLPLQLAFVVAGLFIGFKVWWTPGAAGFLGLIGYFFVFVGILLMSFSLTRILVNTTIDFSLSSLSSQSLYRDFIKKAGLKTARKVMFISTFLVLFFSTITIYFFAKFINNYEYTQLKEFGVYQKVKIKDIDRKGKGSEYAVFDFYFDNKTFTNDLEQKDFSIGDSVDIIFSKNNPEIIEWAEDFHSK